MDIICYDFDKTIYHGDSSTHFAFWCFTHYPKTWLCLPKILIVSIIYALKLWDKTKYKSHLFCYFKMVPDIDKAVSDFWAAHEKNLKPFYLKKVHSDDVIISASPEFLLSGICEKLGVMRLIGTDMDKMTGKIRGKNCHGSEKVERLRKVYPDAHITEFYSDSRSDSPLAEIADKAFLVKGFEILPW